MNSTSNDIRFPGIQVGETFQIGDMEFIKFPDQDGKTPVVMKSIAFFSRFGDDNNLKESDVMKRMVEDILPKIVEVIGERNLCTFKTDLTTLDGLKPYADMESYISLPTLDFYRANVQIFDQHKVDNWWWLATPDSARPHCTPHWILCVSPSGYFFDNCCNFVSGVRPFLIFKSSIFESSEE